MVLKSELERIVENQFQNLAIKEKGIDREKLQKINHKSKMVKIISGIRGCGKSTLLHQIMRTYESYIYLNLKKNSPGVRALKRT